MRAPSPARVRGTRRCLCHRRFCTNTGRCEDARQLHPRPRPARQPLPAVAPPPSPAAPPSNLLPPLPADRIRSSDRRARTTSSAPREEHMRRDTAGCPLARQRTRGFTADMGTQVDICRSSRPCLTSRAAEGRLNLYVTPASAQVLVDGFYVGTVADFQDRSMWLESGPRRIELRADGYEPAAFDVQHRSKTGSWTTEGISPETRESRPRRGAATSRDTEDLLRDTGMLCRRHADLPPIVFPAAARRRISRPFHRW